MKRYIQPEMKVVLVKTANLCAVSTLGVSNTATNNVSGDSREDNAWDIWGTDDYDEE